MVEPPSDYGPPLPPACSGASAEPPHHRPRTPPEAPSSASSSAPLVKPGTLGDHARNRHLTQGRGAAAVPLIVLSLAASVSERVRADDEWSFAAAEERCRSVGLQCRPGESRAVF